MARLMIVDDHPIVREGLKTYLELAEDLSVIAEAGSVASALAMLGQHSIDLILLDLELVDVNGLELLRQVQILPQAPKVLILTSFLEPAYVRDAMRLGAAGYVLKHAGQGHLLDSIRAVLRGEVPMDTSAVKVLAESQRDPLEQLTKREHEVLVLIAQGQSNKAISVTLNIAEKTVKTHVSHILAKLGVNDRVKAALYAKERGL